MSTESPFPPQAASTAPATKPRRLRRFLFASALLLTGGVIGAVVAGPVAGRKAGTASACSTPARSSAGSSASAGWSMP